MLRFRPIMSPEIKHLALAALALGAGGLLATAAPAAVTLDEVSWQTRAAGEPSPEAPGEGGATVAFEARFVNNDNEFFSDPVSGTLRAQPFGAFCDDPKACGGYPQAVICAFEIPSLPPLGDYVVTCEVPYADLPPPADRIHPWKVGAQAHAAQGGCPADDFWSGGVAVSWTGDGDGLEFVDRGTLLVCPRMDSSYIRVLADCADGASWKFSLPCYYDFSTDLVFDNFEQAPNPLPPGSFDGWICVDANDSVPYGGVCAFSLEMTCGDRRAELHLSVETCDCLGATATEPTTWGRIKQQFSR